ncbi:MAG: CoA transferase [Candidatus Omnitrophica bacterium]|nr:CoA transferase [Candidatus Omnitrophota bacterium]
MAKQLFSGIKVLDFTWAAAGPIATKILSDYGAEVVKIESTSHPDGTRIGGPFKDNIVGFNRSGCFNQWNTGKYSILLNIRNSKGLETAKKLAAWADIVVENFSGGTITRIGLGYEELKKINPGIIMLSSCMMGQTGPYAAHPGLGPMLTALSGFNQITGWPDKLPVGPSGAYTDFIGPRFTVLAIIAALDYRRRTGKGQYLDLAQYETSVHFMAPVLLDYLVNRRVTDREGNRLSYAAPHGAYQCQGVDRWCAIAVFTDKEWNSFCKVIGNPDWTQDVKFSTLLARKENEDELDKLVNEWTMNYSAEDVMHLMQAAGVAAGVLQNGQDLQDKDPQLKHRHLYWNLKHPEVGEYHALRPDFLLSKSPYEIKRAPLQGEHNEYVLREILGMSDEEIAELVIEGALE